MANVSSFFDPDKYGSKLSSGLSSLGVNDIYNGKYDFKGLGLGSSNSWRDFDTNPSFKDYVNKNDPMPSYEMFSGLFDKAKNTDKYRGFAEQKAKKEEDVQSLGRAFGMEGKAGQVLDNLAAVYPHQTVLPGSPGSSGMLGTVGGLVGGLGTALGVFGPAGAAIGAGVGGLIDAIA